MDLPRKIVLIGAECTGKTTLAKQLAAHLNTLWVPEYARIYTEAKLQSENGIALAYSDVTAIAWGQLQLEDHFAGMAQEYLVCDTNLLSTAVYSQYYFGEVPMQVEQWLAARPASLYLFLDTDLPWQPDPIRDSESARRQLQTYFLQALQSRNLPYQIIKEPYLSNGSENYTHRRLAHWANLL